MIFDRALRDWAASPERHRRSEAAVTAFGRTWNDGACHRHVEKALASVRGPGADGIVEAVRKLFGQDGWTRALVDSLASPMSEDPFFVPPFRHINSDVHQGLIVYEDGKVAIALGVSAVAQLAAKKNRPRGPTSIGFSGQIQILKFVRSGGARLSFWEAPPIGHTFSASTAGQCRRTSERVVEDGEILVVDGRRQSFVIEKASSNIVILQATVKADLAPLSVEYDSLSHDFVGCSAADDSASRIQMISTLLRKLDSRTAVPVLAAFLDNPNFFVRWHVLREMLGLDAAAALPHLEAMAKDDPHPENRLAASKALDLIASHLTQLGKAA